MAFEKHTPGPWVVNDLYADTEIRGPHNSGVMICVMSPWGIAADQPCPQRANARLIAAAPELLEACQLARDWLGGWASADPYIGRLEAAIAKATGNAGE
jgi:hypothetical protein